MSPRPSEDELIARYFAPLAGPAGLGLRDDAALMRPPPGEDLVLTTDALVAGVHFFPDDAPEDIARKALRVNLSDLAAKGARPRGFLLSLALPRDWREDWLTAFADGLGADAWAYRCPLIGGDTVATPGPLTVSVTAIGSVPEGRMAARTGVKPGDRLYVTGTIGDAAIGLRIRQGRGPDIPQADKAFLLERYLTPEPRVALIGAMVAHANGGMDVSDGFVGDLTKMLDVSGVTARTPDLSAAVVASRARGDRGRSRPVRSRRDRRRRLRTPRFDDAGVRVRLRGGGRGCRRAVDVHRRSGRGVASAEVHRPRRRSGLLRARRLQAFLKDIPMTEGARTLLEMRLFAAQTMAREAGAAARLSGAPMRPSRAERLAAPEVEDALVSAAAREGVAQ